MYELFSTSNVLLEVGRAKNIEYGNRLNLTPLQFLINTIQHEICHAIANQCCGFRDEGQVSDQMEGHGEAFLNLAYVLWGHSKQYSLLYNKLEQYKPGLGKTRRTGHIVIDMDGEHELTHKDVPWAAKEKLKKFAKRWRQKKKKEAEAFSFAKESKKNGNKKASWRNTRHQLWRKKKKEEQEEKRRALAEIRLD